MRYWLLVVTSVVPITARAQPSLDPVEAALRVGVNEARSLLYYGDPLSGGEGTGLVVDGEVGWRYAHWGSVAAFGALSSASASGSSTCYLGQNAVMMTEQFEEHPLFLDLGVRTQVHAGGVFVGFGTGIEIVHSSHSESGGHCFTELGPWNLGPLLEVHAGYTFPAIDGCAACAIQVFAMATGSTVFGSELNATGMLRLAVGMQFR